jgi:uncharacterized protein YcbX
MTPMQGSEIGRVVGIWRYPVKSMQGEELNATAVSERGLLGAQRDEVFDFNLPPGTFFDCAAVHLVTTATLDRLRALNPASRFEVPRFRPNLVIEAAEGSGGFVENGWVGRTLALGDVRLRIDEPCPRCVMTTLSQGSLPKDPAVLRTAVQANAGNVGVYASVVGVGRIRRGDGVCFV